MQRLAGHAASRCDDCCVGLASVTLGSILRQVAAFDRDEGEDPELQDVLPPWDPAELEEEMMLEGSDEGEDAEELDVRWLTCIVWKAAALGCLWVPV